MLRFQVFRRGWDARKKSAIQLVYTIDAEVRDEPAVLARFKDDNHIGPTPDTSYHPVAHAPPGLQKRPVVIGTGPCGFMCALVLAQMGFRPIILERGRIVRERTKDTWGLWRRGVLDPESNAQYGEGGAGTFSDGKLYSQIRDPRHHGRKVLTEFVKAGAPDEILYVAKPHIGTFRLVTVVENVRAEIEALGGEYRFGTKVVDLDIVEGADGERGSLRGLMLDGGGYLEADHVVLAVGHSARDTFEMLHARGVALTAKPFSIGVRIEHPQSLIDQCQFGPSAGNPILGAADYKLVHHGSNGRSVYSFCMCPGGTVVAATSEAGCVATNGMSQYSRAERNANAGIVVGITPEDYPGDPLAGIAFQRHWERKAFEAGGGTYAAPAQTVGDFLAGRASASLGSVVPSYRPERDADRPRAMPARFRRRGDPRGAAAVRAAHPRVRHGRRRDDRRRDAHVVADPHPPRRDDAKPDRARPLSSRRGRRLCRWHPVGGCRWRARRGGGRAQFCQGLNGVGGLAGSVLVCQGCSFRRGIWVRRRLAGFGVRSGSARGIGRSPRQPT